MWQTISGYSGNWDGEGGIGSGSWPPLGAPSQVPQHGEGPFPQARSVREQPPRAPALPSPRRRGLRAPRGQPRAQRLGAAALLPLFICPVWQSRWPSSRGALLSSGPMATSGPRNRFLRRPRGGAQVHPAAQGEQSGARGDRKSSPHRRLQAFHTWQGSGFLSPRRWGPLYAPLLNLEEGGLGV